MVRPGNRSQVPLVEDLPKQSRLFNLSQGFPEISRAPSEILQIPIDIAYQSWYTISHWIDPLAGLCASP